MNDDFYVGYHPEAPAGLSMFVRRSISFVAVVAASLAVLLALGQIQFDPSRFEYGTEKEFAGTLALLPYPTLIPNDRSQPYLLVSRGKHGATLVAAPFNRRTVQLTGTLIENGPNRAIEIASSTATRFAGAGAVPQLTSFGEVTLTGEIVDTKCYFGVMNPGRGKVHRDCAVRCISGGVPPGLLVRDRSGTTRTLLLAGENGQELHQEILDYVAEPITLSGALYAINGQFVLHARLATLTRLTARE